MTRTPAAGRLVLLLLVAAAVRPSAALADCSVSVQGGLSFGTYNVFSAAPLDTTGTIAYRCGNRDKDIRITLGRGSSATYNPRTLQNGSGLLAYNVFTDAARTRVWGDQTEGTDLYSVHNPPNETWVTLTMYGRVAARQDVAAGTYSDTLTVDINF